MAYGLLNSLSLEVHKFYSLFMLKSAADIHKIMYGKELARVAFAIGPTCSHWRLGGEAHG